ncbi:uncharacterized protein LOC143920606 [Arctopsyche grandis]|uniref:uncharacterized protein LOC143920606 n=1 Tax=Arctopsyche grandis TaxID=121162 RepID=UPI00406D7BD8
MYSHTLKTSNTSGKKKSTEYKCYSANKKAKVDYGDLNELVWIWFMSSQCNDTNITEEILISKAEEYAGKLKYDKFQDTQEWLSNFKRNKNLVCNELGILGMKSKKNPSDNLVIDLESDSDDNDNIQKLDDGDDDIQISVDEEKIQIVDDDNSQNLVNVNIKIAVNDDNVHSPAVDIKISNANSQKLADDDVKCKRKDEDGKNEMLNSDKSQNKVDNDTIKNKTDDDTIKNDTDNDNIQISVDDDKIQILDDDDDIQNNDDDADSSGDEEFDEESYTIEERVMVAVWVRICLRHNKNMTEIQQRFAGRFKKESPPERILLVWEKRLFETGSIVPVKNE